MTELELDKILNTKVITNKRDILDCISTFVGLHLNIEANSKELDDIRTTIFLDFEENFDLMFKAKKLDC